MRLLIVFIIVVSGLVLVATTGTIVVGSRSFEGIVVDKPYEAGLTWDEAGRNRERLGWKVALQSTLFTTGKNDLILIVADRNGAPLANAKVFVTVTRPSTRAYDRLYETSQRPGGRYQANIELPLYGNWEIATDVRRGADRTGFKEPIFANKVEK